MKASREYSYASTFMHEAIARRAGLSGADHKYLGIILQHGQLTAGELSKSAEQSLRYVHVTCSLASCSVYMPRLETMQVRYRDSHVPASPVRGRIRMPPRYRYGSWPEQFEGCVYSILWHHSASPVRNVTLRVLFVLELLTWPTAGIRAARIERTVVHCGNVRRLWWIVHRRASAECRADRDGAELRDEVAALATPYFRRRIGTRLRDRAFPLVARLLR